MRYFGTGILLKLYIPEQNSPRAAVRVSERGFYSPVCAEGAAKRLPPSELPLIGFTWNCKGASARIARSEPRPCSAVARRKRDTAVASRTTVQTTERPRLPRKPPAPVARRGAYKAVWRSFLASHRTTRSSLTKRRRLGSRPSPRCALRRSCRSSFAARASLPARTNAPSTTGIDSLRGRGRDGRRCDACRRAGRGSFVRR